MIAAAPLGLIFIAAFVLTVTTMFYLMLRKA
jgi:hypothetical protein